MANGATEDDIKKSPLTIGGWIFLICLLGGTLILGINTQMRLTSAAKEVVGHHEGKNVTIAHPDLPAQFPQRTEILMQQNVMNRKLDKLIAQGEQNIVEHKELKERLTAIERRRRRVR